MDRPRLDDPNEFAIIRSMYFQDNIPLNEEIDSIEKLERMESRSKFNKQTPR